MTIPTLGDSTIALKLKSPVNNANTVASIFLGVIFANSTSTGI